MALASLKIPVEFPAARVAECTSDPEAFLLAVAELAACTEADRTPSVEAQEIATVLAKHELSVVSADVIAGFADVTVTGADSSD